MAAILADRELERLLACLELPTELPKTAPARSPPFDFGEEGKPESQANPLADLNDGIDDRAFAAEREEMVEAFSRNHVPAGEELTPA